MTAFSDTKHDIKRDTKEDSPPPYLDATSSQIYTVDYANWRRSVSILEPTGQPIFTTHSPGPCCTRLEISNNHGQVIGTSKSSNWSSKVDVQILHPAQSFEMHNSGSVFGGSPEYTSPAFNSQKVVWKNKAMSRRIIYTLVDSKGQGVARFESDPKSKFGKLELTHEAVEEQRLNEIVVTLMTLLHRKLRNIRSSEIAAGVAAVS